MRPGSLTKEAAVELRAMSDIRAEADAAIVAEIRRGLDAGMTQAEVAEAMGTSASTLCRFLQRKGLRVARRVIEPN